jgi:hypothetical protein
MGTVVLRSASGRIVRSGGKAYTGAEPLIFTGTSNTFPFTFQNIAGQAPPNSALQLVFTVATTVKIDYGDGTVRYLNTIPTGQSYANSVIIAANNTIGAPYTDAQYTYPDGLNILRTVKISYDRGSLREYRHSYNWGMPQQPLNFAWYAHNRLETFANQAAYVTDINLVGLSSTTNPYLKTLSVSFFGSSSQFYNKIPESILQIPLENLTLGGIGYNNQGMTMAQMNIDKIGINPIKDTLKSLTFINITAWTDAQGLPANFVNLTALESISFNSARYTTFPAPLNAMTWLKGFNYNNSSAYLTGWSGIENLINLDNINFNYSTVVAGFGNFPTAWNNFTKLRTVSFANSGVQIAANTTAYVDMLYDFITRNNTPKTGSNSGTIPFRGMILNLSANGSATNVTGTVQAPAGFVLGSNNGTPANTGEKIYVLRNQYGTTVTIST